MSNEVLRDKRLWTIFGITMIAVMGVASITPALPKISETLNLSKTQIGLLISAFTFPGIFLTPVAGIMADRLGRKRSSFYHCSYLHLPASPYFMCMI